MLHIIALLAANKYHGKERGLQITGGISGKKGRGEGKTAFIVKGKKRRENRSLNEGRIGVQKPPPQT